MQPHIYVLLPGTHRQRCGSVNDVRSRPSEFFAGRRAVTIEAPACEGNGKSALVELRAVSMLERVRCKSRQVVSYHSDNPRAIGARFHENRRAGGINLS